MRKLPLNQSVKVRASFLDQNNRPMANQGAISYSSSDPSIASVDAASGLVTGNAEGTCSITATSGGLSDSAEVTVYVPVVSSLAL